MVDLERGEEASGHVKCWEQFARAATTLQGELDLTVHFLADEEMVSPLAANVRFVTHRPIIDSRRLRFLGAMPGRTDLAPGNRRLHAFLDRYDVIHTTDAFFALARTALRFSRAFDRPLVTSLHTDVPSYTGVFVPQVVRRVFGTGRLRALLLGGLRLSERAAGYMRRKLERYLSRCDWVLVSKRAEVARRAESLGHDRVSLLRRGVDLALFRPRPRGPARPARPGLAPPGRVRLLYVGRIDAAKKVMVVARATRLLLDRGVPVQLVIAGEGSQREEIAALLGDTVTFTGVLPHEELAWIYASADLFVFASETEECPNVVLEAKASGLPVVLSSHAGASQLVTDGLDGLVIRGSDPRLWQESLESLVRDPSRLERMRQAARSQMESVWPSWRDVLLEDLLPVWSRLARGLVMSPALTHRGVISTGGVLPPPAMPPARALRERSRGPA